MYGKRLARFIKSINTDIFAKLLTTGLNAASNESTNDFKGLFIIIKLINSDT